jgi:hypothetical protein
MAGLDLQHRPARSAYQDYRQDELLVYKTPQEEHDTIKKSLDILQGISERRPLGESVRCWPPDAR